MQVPQLNAQPKDPAGKEGCKSPPDLAATIRSIPSARAYYALGKYFADRNQSVCAIGAFRTAVRLDPAAWEGHYNYGLALLTSKWFNDAETELAEVVRLRPEWPDAHNVHGSALKGLGRTREAEGEFRAALKLNPGNPLALQELSELLIAAGRYAAAIAVLTPPPTDFGLRTNLAVALSRTGKTGEAVTLLKQLVAEYSGSSAAHFNLAVELANQKRYRECVGEYQEALRLDPSNSTARTSLVKAYNILAEFSEALPLIESYAGTAGGDAEAPYLLGEVYRGLGRYEDAIAPLRKAVRLRPNHYESLYNLGFVLAKTGQNASALPYLERAAKLRPGGVDARYQLAMVLKALNQPARASREFALFQEEKRLQAMKDVAAVDGGRANELLTSGDAKEAVQVYGNSLASDPDNPRTYYNLALALDRLGDTSGEREALEHSIRLDPTLTAAQNQLGLLLLREGKLDEAQSHLEKALAADPQFAEAQNNLGVLSGQRGNSQRAEELFRRAIENNSTYAQAYLNLGLILAGQSKFPEAETQIEKALTLQPELSGALTALGMVRARMGRSREAIEAFRKVLIHEPTSAEAHLNLGIALADGFDVQGALSEFSQAAALAPDNAAVRYNKGRSLFDLRRYADAEKELDHALRLNPDAFQAMYLLALTEKQLDHRERSVELLRNAIRLQPDDADAHFLLGQNFFTLGNSREAIVEWKRAVEINPQHTQALSNLIRALNDTDPQSAAAYRLQFDNLQSKRMITDRAGTLSNFALASADAHDWEQAVSQMKEAIEVCANCPSLGTLHKNFGLMYCRSGNLVEGEQQLRVADKLLPGDAEIKRSLDLIESAKRPPDGHDNGGSR